MNKKPHSVQWWRKILRFVLYTFFALLLLATVLLYALTLPAVQQQLTSRATSFLQKKLGTRVEIGAIRLRFPEGISIEKLLVEDRQGDTLARVGRLAVSLDYRQLTNQVIALQEISLEDAGVYLHHKDSIDNYDFIVAAFSGPGNKPASADTTASSWKLQLELAKIQLKQINFLLQDDDAANTIKARIGLAETVITQADLPARQFELDRFQLTDSDVQLIDRKKSTKSSKPSPAYEILVKNADIVRSHLLYSTPEIVVDARLEKSGLRQIHLQSIDGDLAIQTQGVTMENSAVAYRDPEALPTSGHLNAGDLDLTEVFAEIPVFSFQHDTLYVQASALSGRDKSGLQVHSLRAITRVTPGSIEIKDALASMNRTSLDGDIVLYKNSKATFDRMRVDLRQVNGIIGDLILLLPPQQNPALERLGDMPYEVSGTLNGWLQYLQTDYIRLKAGSGTVAYFTGSVQHLTEPAKLGMNLNITRMETNRADLIRWMSVGDMPADSLLAQPLPASLSVSGEVSGTMANLQLILGGTAGPLQTGPVQPPDAGPFLQFDVTGTLTQVNNADSLGMDILINGLDAPRNFFALWETGGLQMPDMLHAGGTLRGTLQMLRTDLQFNARRGGAISDLVFKGSLKNLRTQDQLGFDVSFDGNIARQEILGYIPDSTVTRVWRLPDFVQVKGAAKGTVNNAATTVNIGLSALGQIYLDGTLQDSTYRLNLSAQNVLVSRLMVDTTLRPIKTIGFNARMTGTGFQVGRTAALQLTGQIDSLIWDNLILRHIALDADVQGRKFSGGFESPDPRVAVRARVEGDFSTAIPVLETDISINCLEMREFGWVNRPTVVCMHVVSHSEGLSVDTLNAQVKIEQIDLQYDTVHIRPGDLAIDLSLDNHRNNIRLESDWLQGEIQGFFELSALSTTVASIAEQYFVVDRTGYVPPIGTDSLMVQLHLIKTEVLTTGLIPGLTALDPVRLEGSLVAPRHYFNMSLAAPHIVYRTWDVDSLNVRAYAGDTAALFVLTTPLVKRGEQDFIENTVFNGQFLANVADISFKASSDDGRERFLLKLQALLNQKTKETLITVSPRQVIDFQEWTVNADNQVLINPKGVEIKRFQMAGNGQTIQIEGATRKLGGGKTGLDFNADIDRLNYKNFDIFIAGLVRDLDGWAEAHVTVKGTTDAPKVRGKIQLHETSFTPVLTNVHYQLSETPIELTETGIVLDGLILRDPFGKTLEINGKLTTSDWANIRTDLTLHADRWQVLNSTRQQNPVYFGELYVSLDGTIRGPVSQPDIQLVVKTAKESTFTYVYDVATQALQHEGIVYFVAPPRQYVRPPIYDAPVNVQPYTLSASIEIDSNLTVNSVINPVTGDDFRGKATGKLQFDLLSNGIMTLAGRVELVRGVYNYSYQSVVKRSFEVTTGSSITWTGDVLAPELDLKARYQFKASPYPLVVNQLSTASAEETAVYRKPQTFFLQTTLSGSVRQPDISFQFIYPSAEKQASLGANFGSQEEGLVQSALGNVNNDKNLLSRQVFGVLLLRNFIGETVGIATTTSGGNPLQSGLSSFLTGQLNALADQYLTWIDVDLATTEGSTNTGATQAEGTTNYQLRLQKSFFEDRLTFKISGGTSVGGANGDDVHSALENASVEYALTANGELKVTVFSERGFELLNASSANLRNSGAGIILTKEFGGK